MLESVNNKLKYTTELFKRVNKFMNDTSGIYFNVVYAEYHYHAWNGIQLEIVIFKIKEDV